MTKVQKRTLVQHGYFYRSVNEDGTKTRTNRTQASITGKAIHPSIHHLIRLSMSTQKRKHGKINK